MAVNKNILETLIEREKARQTRDRVGKVLYENKDKDFVQRISQIAGSPNYEWIPGPQGKGKSTHSMASSEQDGRYYVYPTVQRSEEGKLKRYGFKDGEAFRRARKTGEAIEFPTREDAEFFSNNYKAFWPK